MHRVEILEPNEDGIIWMARSSDDLEGEITDMIELGKPEEVKQFFKVWLAANG